MAQEDAEMQDDTKIDESLYSRQLYVMGHEAMKKMRESNVLIAGLNGLGVEMAKNIILAGVKSVTLLDNTPTRINDLASQFYLSEKDIGKPRAAACLDKLRELNRYVPLEVISDSLSVELIQSKKYQVVVVIDQPISKQLEINNTCRANGVKFISADVCGVFAALFVDNGDEFIVTDTNGEQPLNGIVADISHDKEGIVLCDDEQRHGLEDGDHVAFEEVQGMTEVNGGKTFKVTVKSPLAFCIGDTTAFAKYERKGLWRQVKQPAKLSFQSLEAQLANPEILPSDFCKFDRHYQWHCFYQALGRFRTEAGRLPDPTSADEAKRVVDITKEIAAASEQKPDIDETLIGDLARCSAAVINPMCAFLGGVAAQEVLKACTGKFTPLRQFLYFDAAEVLPEGVEDLSAYAPQGGRYDDIIAVFGRELHERVTKLNYFLVGSGAIGCEMMKNWALMGLGCGEGGLVTVTDMDTIEKSNLNRQFLFRPRHVGQMKSLIAAQEAKGINPAIKVEAKDVRVGGDTEDVYDDAFWEKLDGVTNALDNVQARLYVDSRCVYFNKSLLESGTLGTKGNTQVVVPKLTESYGSTRDPPEQGIPICTLKNFPYKIEHTIQWARDDFQGTFHNPANDVNSYLKQADYLKELAKETNEAFVLERIKQYLVDDRAESYEQCVARARMKFEKDFNHQISQLLYNFPSDRVTKEGTPFWSGHKRCPDPLKFDEGDPVHASYVFSCANLFAFIYGLSHKGWDQARVAAMAQTIEIPEWQPRKGITIATTKEEAKEEADNALDADDAETEALRQALPKPESLAGYELQVVEFEKDDDANFHMDFITAAANLRAQNYKIKQVSKFEAKGIAGKIIPAMATTTALVTGLVCLELYKLIQGKKIEAYKNAFVNLALPLFAMSEPVAPPTEKSKKNGKDWDWNLWDKVTIDEGDITLGEFLELMEERYGWDVTMLSYGAAMVHAFFTPAAKQKARKAMPMSVLCETISKTKVGATERFLVLEACVDDVESGEEADIPQIRFKFR